MKASILGIGAVLLALAAISARTQVMEPREPPSINLPGPLTPPLGIPYIDKREKKVLDCLSKQYGERSFYAFLYGDEPAPSAPNAATNCRLSRVVEVVDSFRPPETPDDLVFRSDDLRTLADWDLRDYIAALLAKAAVWNEVIELERRVATRFATIATARAMLEGKVAQLNTLPASKWPVHWTGFVMHNPQCLGDTPAEQEEALKKLRQEYEPFAFYSEYQEVAFGVSLLGQEVLPQGIAYCEKGGEQKACFTPRPRDWSAPGCWDRSPPRHYLDVPCSDNSGGLLKQLTQMGAGSGCSQDIQGILSPFFAERKTTVDARRKDESYHMDVDQFLKVLLMLRDAISRTAPAFAQTRKTAVARIAPQYSRLGADLNAENERLIHESELIRAEREALNTLTATIQKRRDQLTLLGTTIDALSQKLKGSTQALALARSDTLNASETLERAQTELTTTHQQKSAAQLQCGGASYAECQNEVERLRYDEALYHAMEAIDAAMAMWSQALDSLATSIERELDGELIVIDLEGTLARQQAIQADQQIVLLQEEEDLTARTTTLATRQENYDRLKKGHDRDAERLAIYKDELKQ